MVTSTEQRIGRRATSSDEAGCDVQAGDAGVATRSHTRAWPVPRFLVTLLSLAMVMVATTVIVYRPAPVYAAGAHGAGVALDRAHINLADKASLQRGARLFVNYCLSCHSASYMRYNRMGTDLGISEELIKKNLLFAGANTGDLMITTMPEEYSKQWFGVSPPDLSLVGRARGGDWLYTYMRGFYLDETTPSGWNNSLFENVAMPHALYELQGIQRPVMESVQEVMSGEVVTVEKIARFTIEHPGALSVQEYDSAVLDLVNFMVYMSEPARLTRYTIGFWTIVFLLALLVPAYFLKKEYWKDVN